VSTRIVPGCVQFLGQEKRFYTVWVDYELTDLGRGLWQPVEALGVWAAEHQAEIESARARFDGRNEAGPPDDRVAG
jgi:hypothetical protein